jgi:hypothetical protein
METSGGQHIATRIALAGTAGRHPSRGILFRPADDAPEAEVAGGGVDRLALPGRRPVAQAVAGRQGNWPGQVLAIIRPPGANSSPHAQTAPFTLGCGLSQKIATTRAG